MDRQQALSLWLVAGLAGLLVFLNARATQSGPGQRYLGPPAQRPP